MWEPRPLATLGTSTACNRDIFTFLYDIPEYWPSLLGHSALPEGLRRTIKNPHVGYVVSRTRYESGVSQVWVRRVTARTNSLLTTGTVKHGSAPTSQQKTRNVTFLLQTCLVEWIANGLQWLDLSALCFNPGSFFFLTTSLGLSIRRISIYDELKNAMSKPDFIRVKKTHWAL
jgi:hypothetical protein